MTASVLTDAVRDLWGPGLVFVALCAWLIRRAVRAARNESILEEQRLRDAFGDPLLPGAKTATPGATTGIPNSTSSTPTTSTPSPGVSPSVSVPPDLFRADVRGASQEHLDVLARLVRERDAAAVAPQHAEILWVRGSPTHVAWAELRAGDREVICVAQIDSGKIVARWQFG